MGVAGSGKTTVARRLAEALGLPYDDADAYHGPAARKKLARDEPLDDALRRPMLQRVAARLRELERSGGGVIACSALKRRYRELLLDGTSAPIVVFLRVPYAAARRRLEARQGHHPLISDYERIAAGQFRDLEEPTNAIVIEAGRALDDIVDEAIRSVRESIGGANGFPRTGR